MVADVDKTKDLALITNGARGLRQDDLSSIVLQSNLSAILAGKRKISATLAGKFGKFFGVSPSIFVPR
jgi:HTH-type transcriptional regulator/antitoxin HigA